MKTLKRIYYDTMSSWNNAKAPAYNLKIYNVINDDLQNMVFAMMDTEDFYTSINDLIDDFNRECDFIYQAGFNGRSGGYLVLYKGGKKLSEHKSYCTDCGQRNFTAVEENNNVCGQCGKPCRINHTFYTVFTNPGQSIDAKDVPVDVLRRFRQLAVDIVKETEFTAKNCKIAEEEYTVVKTRKVLEPK